LCVVQVVKVFILVCCAGGESVHTCVLWQVVKVFILVCCAGGEGVHIAGAAC